MTTTTVTGFNALEGLHKAIEECRRAKPCWRPNRDGTRDFVVVYAGFVAISSDTLVTLPGVTVIAAGRHVEFNGAPVRLIDFDSEQWVTIADDSGTILNPGPYWAEMLTRGTVVGS